MKKEIEELKKDLNVDSVAQALREVREYAAMAVDLNIDTLQIKLIHLDEVGRRTRHDDRELFSVVLQTFLCHKSRKNIGFLVTSLLSTPAESKIYEKEQNLLKLHGNENVSQADNTMAKTTTAKPSESENFSNMMQFMQMFNNAAFMPPSPTIMANFSPRRGGYPVPRPRAPYSYSGCYKYVTCLILESIVQRNSHLFNSA